jgi:hypothetical protein
MSENPKEPSPLTPLSDNSNFQPMVIQEADGQETLVPVSEWLEKLRKPHSS